MKSLWFISLIDNSSGRAQLTVCGTTLGFMLLGVIRKQAEYSKELCFSSRVVVVYFFPKVQDLTGPENLARFPTPGLLSILLSGPEVHLEGCW